MIDARLMHNPGRSTMMAIMAIAALALALALSSAHLMAQEEPGAMPGLTLTSENPGELVISWNGPEPAPSDYRISWAPTSKGHISWQDDNEADRGNAYPQGTERSHTVTGLPAGEDYKVRMRARYNAGQYADNPWSGPWEKATITLAQEPEPEPAPTPVPTPPAPTQEPVEETTPPTTTLSATTPVVGKPLTATLVDPDALVSGESWSWSSSTTITGTFTAIAGAASAIYTPTVEDLGSYLRATASYSDESESDQSVSVDSTDATIANPSPTFTDVFVTFSVMENLTTGEVGTVTATDPDNDTLTYSVDGTDTVEFDGDFSLNVSSGAITVKSDAAIDYESKSSYTVTITATDTFGGRDTIEVTITVDEAVIEEPAVVGGSIQTLTIVDTAEPEQISVSWVGPTGPAADRFQIAWTFEGMEYTQSRDRNVTTQEEEFTITGISELTAYAIRVRAHFETEEDGVYTYGPWLEQIHTTAALPAARPEPIVTAPAPVREASEDHTTGLIPLVSNSGLPGTTGSMWVNSQTTVSQKFRTGSAQQGYTLNEVELELTPKAGNAAVTLSVHASSGPSYGARLFELTPPADLDADVDVFKAPANSVLQPNTEYWLVIGTTADSAGDVNLVLSDSDTTDDTTLEGFSLLQMNIDVDAPGLTLPITGSLTDALGALGGGGASSGGSGTRGSPSTSTSTNVIRMVINGHHVGDVPAGITTQAGLTLGEVRTGYTNFKNDADWYRVELKAGVRYVFDAYLKDPYKPDSVRLYGIYNNSSPDPMSMSIEYVHRYLLRDYAIEGSSTARAEFNPWGRAYFTPSADGTFFVAAGVRQTHTANYKVKYDEADTETEDTATPAIAATGINSPYHGEFFTPNGTLTESADYDVDWIRVSLQAGENYQFLVDVPYIYTKVDINAVYDSAGVIVPDFVPGTSQRTKDERGFWPNHSWAIAHFQPAATGDYYVEITGSSAERHDGVTTTAGVKSAIYVTDAYFGSQYTFYLTGTGQPNADESETATDTLGHGNVFVDGFIDTDNSSVSGRIDARGDVDWYRVWFDEGEQYMIFLDDEGDSDVRLAGIWEWPTVYLDNSFDRNFSYTSVEARTEITTKCGFAVVRAEETGFHFIELTSSKQGEYAMSVFPLDDRPTTDEMTLGGDVGRCVHPGFLFSGDAATGTFQQAGEWDTYAVWFRVGVEYQIEARGSSSGSGTATDPVMYIQDSTGNADSSGFNKGTGNDDLWNKVANRWDLHLIHVSGNHSVAGHTYSIGFEEIGVVNEPDFADFMPDGNPRAGYLATGQVLRGNLSPGDQYDGFRIVTKPGKSYSVSAQAVNIKNWARNNMSNYDDMYLIVRRFDGTNYVVVDSSVDDGYIVKDRYRDSGIHLHFEAEEPPTGVTYEYLGEIRAWNEAQQLYVGGYTISLREDDRRRIFNAEDYPAESAETLVDQGFVWGNIETAGDYDSFVFNLVSGKEYQIGVRSDHSSDGRTIDNIVADSLKWISGVGSQKTTGGLDSAALVVAGDSSNGEFIMTYTPTISGLYILTVNSADGNTGTYTVQIKDVTPISIPGPIGKAIVGQELSLGDLTKLETDLGETPTYTSYQWLRDGIAIPGATGTTYTLVGDTVVEATALIPAAGAIPAVPATYKTVFADSGHRISIRITYALADTSTGRAKSVATSHVIGVNLKLIGRLDQGGNVTQTGNNERATIWHGFTTGNNPNGYVIDRVLIHSATVPRFGNRISKDLIKSFVEGTGNLGTYDPTAGDRKFELFPDGKVDPISWTVLEQC